MKTLKTKIDLRKATQRVIGLIGYAGSGKDTVAELLGIPGCGFADALKDCTLPLARMFGLDILTNRADKDVFREVLVAVGRLGRQLDPDFWVKRLELPDAPTVAVRDVRYLNECEAILAVGGTLAYVSRPGVGPANEEEDRTIQEIFEAAREGMPLVQIDNSGGLEDLEVFARRVLDYPLPYVARPEKIDGCPCDYCRPRREPRVIHQDEVQVGRKLDIQEGDIYVSREARPMISSRAPRTSRPGIKALSNRGVASATWRRSASMSTSAQTACAWSAARGMSRPPAP
jgi:hypothetical protein